MNYYDKIPANELYHHGVKGMKWGIRRYQNKDGSLTNAGKKHLQKRQLSEKENWSNRKAVDAKTMKEVSATKEGKAWNDLVKKRGIKQSNGKVTLSYLKDDWSNPDKVMDQMVKDMNVEQAYLKKEREIAKKYVSEYSGAMLRDLGLMDTKSGREYVQKYILRY